ncbi:MAG TPA: hypothetical protein PKI14_13055 [Fervidobacterium sp.]|nr:hypothetical protein [Fervidobacterium sp.]
MLEVYSVGKTSIFIDSSAFFENRAKRYFLKHMTVPGILKTCASPNYLTRGGVDNHAR